MSARLRDRDGMGYRDRATERETERARQTERQRRRGGHRNTSVFRFIPQHQKRFIGVLGSRFRL